MTNRGLLMNENEYKTRSVGSEFNGQAPLPFTGGRGRKKRSWNTSSSKVENDKDSSGTENVPGQKVSQGKDSSETKNVSGQKVSQGKDSSGTENVPGQVKDNGAAGKKYWDAFEAAVFIMQLRKTRKDLTIFLFDKANNLNSFSTPVIEVKDVLCELKIGESNYRKTAGRLVEQGCFYRNGLTAGGTIYTFFPEIFSALKKLRSRF